LGAAIDTRITALEALTIADLQIEWRRLYRAAPPTREDEPTLSLSHPIHLRRAGKEVRMVIDRADPFALPAKPDPSLIKAIGRAHHYYALLVKHGPGKFADLAKSEGLNRSYYSRLLRLAYLAPDITTAILDGRQPEGLTATTLIEHPNLPLSWSDQRSVLGFI
jgi:site-specific DNA recombinase